MIQSCFTYMKKSIFLLEQGFKMIFRKFNSTAKKNIEIHCHIVLHS